MKRFKIRCEAFGATVFDNQKLDYFFINKQQLIQLHLPIINYDFITIKEENDISDGKFIKFWDFSKKEDSSVEVLIPENSDLPLPTDTLVAPVRVYFETTLACNQNCPYCLNNSGYKHTRPGQQLTLQEKLKAIEKMAPYVCEVRLTGGEVTLDNFIELGNHVKNNNMALSINSNLMISNATLQQLINLRPALLITSLDGLETSHKQSRGQGFRKIEENIRELRKQNVNVRINCMLNRHTFSCVSEFIDYFTDLGVDFTFIIERPTGRLTNFNPTSLEDLYKAVNIIDLKQKQYPHLNFSTSFHVVQKVDKRIGDISLTGCNAIQKSFNLNSIGGIQPCAFLGELHEKFNDFGNIREHNYSLLSIWRNSSQLRELRERSRNTNLRCINCEFFNNNCLGSCVMMNLYSEITGQIDPYCFKNKHDKN